MPAFSVIDYAVIAAYLVGVVLLGVAFSRRQKSLEEFFHASGSLPWWAVGISMFATMLSPISYLAGPGWIFAKDTRFALIGTIVNVPLFVLAAAIWVPVWSRLRVMSIYEYLEKRYHPVVRIYGASLFVVGTNFWLSTALVTAAMGFESVSGFDGRLALLVIVVIGTAYTVLGGMRAVIWTDVAQFGIFMVGYAAMAIIILANFGWDPMEMYRVASSKISPDTGYPHTTLVSYEFSLAVEGTIWVVVFIRMIDMVRIGTDQMFVQRMHAAGSKRAMFKSIVGGALCIAVFGVINTFTSWGFVAFYHQNPELATMSHPDQVLPHFALQKVPIVMRSLLMAGVLAALMSSFDSALNSMSNITITDFYRRFSAKEHSEHHLVVVSKILSVAFGTILLLFSLFQYQHAEGTALQRLGILTNLILSPVISFFVLGLFSKRVNTPGVLCGAAVGFVTALLLNGFPGLMGPVYSGVNWMWVGGLSLVVNLVVGYAASFLFPPPSESQLTDP